MSFKVLYKQSYTLNDPNNKRVQIPIIIMHIDTIDGVLCKGPSRNAFGKGKRNF